MNLTLLTYNAKISGYSLLVPRTFPPPSQGTQLRNTVLLLSPNTAI